MSHEALSDNLSPNAKAILDQLFNVGDSQSLAVAECLNTIAENGEDSASDGYLVVCAQEIRDAATTVMKALDPTGKHRIARRRRL
jgi:hypothetical protein